MDFPDLFEPAYALGDFQPDPPIFHRRANLKTLAELIQAMRGERAMEAHDTTLLTASSTTERRRALIVTIRHADGSIAHDLRVVFRDETFEQVRQAIRTAGQPRLVA